LAGNIIIKNKDNLSNEYLKEIAELVGVDLIYWYNPSGEILFAATNENIGWKAEKGDPIFNFMESGKQVFMEEIRRLIEREEYFKFGYIRTSDGSFVQIGYKAEEVYKLTDKYSFQSIVERVASGDNDILYARIVDTNYKVMADSDGEDIGIVYDEQEEYKKVLTGENSFHEGYYEKIDGKVFQVEVSLMRDNKIQGIVGIGLSMDYANKNILIITIRTLLIVIVMLLIFLWFQIKVIIKPINLLNKHIKSIYYKGDELNKLPILENLNFKGLYLTINELLDNVHQSITKMKKMNDKMLLIMEESGVFIWEINRKTEEVLFPYGTLIQTKVGQWQRLYDVVDEFVRKEDRTKFFKTYIEYNEGISNKIYCELPMKDNNGDSKWFAVIGKHSDEENKEVINGLTIDISKYKEQEKQIEKLAYYDYLTNLPNRSSFYIKLDKLIIERKAVAIMLLDLNDFKYINDTRGHVFGDKLLMSVSKELVDISSEDIYISRFGGDEFLLMIESDDLAIISKSATRIISRFDYEFLVGDENINIGASMGISYYPKDDETIEGLIGKADMAMYAAKDKQKNNYVYYSEKMLKDILEKDEIEKILREAIKNDGFKLLYQPLINTDTKEIISFEALIRLKEHYLSPDKFIKVAEEKNLINKIGRWVIKEAVSQIAQWQKKGSIIKPVSVNLSVKQMKDENFIEYLEDILNEYQVDSKYIHIEITESLLIEDENKAKDFMDKLKTIGTKILIDDFGSGYTSIQYLGLFPVHIVKFDKLLIDKYLNEENKSVISYLILMAKELDLEVVAEGVETLEQYEMLKELNCDYIQGYFFSRPLEKDDIEQKLKL
jgi:diguanylate cyclase (GGDEF)-like protein